MAYDPSFIKEVVGLYLAQSPTAENSAKIVQEISATKRLAVAKIRGLLVRQGVYRAQPKAKTSVEPSDSAKILAQFQSFAAYDDGSYAMENARWGFVEELRKTAGYTAAALEEFAKREGVWPISKSEHQRSAKIKAEFDAIDRDVKRKMDNVLEDGRRERKELKRQFDYNKRYSVGIFNPNIAVFIVCVIALALISAAIKSLFE